jgi:hypothetical protein
LSEVWKLPEHLLLPVYSRTVTLKLASGKSVKTIEVEDTMDNFAAMDKFEGKVEKLGENKYAVTVDDSLVIFK